MDDKRRKDELPYEVFEEPQLMEVPIEKPAKRPYIPFLPVTTRPAKPRILN